MEFGLMIRRAATLVLTVLAAVASHAAAATVTVPAGGNLQAALNNAQPGDTILLAAGATYTGNFVLPAKTGTAFITIRSNAADASLPAAGTRITPASASLLPKLQSASGAMPALSTAPGAAYYVIQFVEFLPNPSGAGAMIELGTAATTQSSLSVVPHDLVVDRCYLHASPGVAQLRGIALNSGKTTIRDSYIAEIKYVGQDSQAIAGWNGTGPFTIVNNYLEAAGENFLMGGSSMFIPNVTPTGIVFRNNYCTKQTAWRNSSWSVKNLFELKHAQDVTVDGNVFENNWLAAQPGYAIVFTPRNQYNDNPWTVVQRVTFTNNIVRHVSSAFNILGYDNNAPSLQTNHITIRNNVLEDVDGTNWGGVGRVLLISQAADVTLDHNTGFNGGTGIYAYGGLSTRFVFTNNIASAASYGIMGDAAGEGSGTIATYFSDGTFQENLFVGTTKTSLYPGQCFFPASMSAVGFVNLPAGDYHLASTSPYAGKATDGTDPGANIDALAAAQAGGGSSGGGSGSGGGGGGGGGTASSVPSPWSNADVGAVGLAGHATYANATFTEAGAGADMWGTADAFNFTYRPLNGDGQIVARVASTQNTNTYAKAGVVIREDLTAGATSVLLSVRPAGGVEFLARTAAGGTTASAASATGTAPLWVKLARAGNVFTAAMSADGATWTNVGSTTVTMAANAYVGLAVCSHSTAALDTSTFDNVTVASAAVPLPPPAPGGLTDQDVGAVGLAGSASVSGSTYTVKGAGADVWGTADAFNFASQALGGDGQVVARLTAVQNTNAYAKAGVMIRDGSAAGAASVMLDVKPGGGTELLVRAATGAATSYAAGGSGTAPIWLKLVRAGSTFTGYSSSDGATWASIGSATVSMPAAVKAGLAVCSHNTAQLNASTFDNVAVTAAGGTAASTEIVLYASDLAATALHGSWVKANDSTAAAGVVATTTDAGWSTTGAPLAQPADYVDVTFNAQAGTPYALWMRVRASANSKYNDSVWVQFSDARANGAAVYPLNGTAGLMVNLENCSGCGVAGWGWQNTAYWLSQATTVTFATTGTHTMRIQVREDGVQIDQIVLSAAKYLSAAPGGLKNDATIVAK
jgi:regulation of enolase protein 1 (concanavalin A-like superfamily)